ncbi:6-phosphogluconolactonase [Solidesulfovibrio fructosivorans JJ]]|uniref:6-phosphogluconolactonase n=1 Tax=Solidesulfovibrio fructosivorans JJ] TaxID=596151 RepID=E1JSB8_SOLFR|nr:6-phosphogluconolactonase [Solidesulfovibrio fructosivorans]EFL52887.1 6-phosphogluconolactonase [Solidesulfovibrio fructosivorans JJ]]
MSARAKAFPSPAAMTEAALAYVAEAARESVAARGRFALALSGGSTPLPLYAAMARRGFGAPPQDTLFFFGDERLVPVGDPRSNFGAISPILFTPSPIPVGNIRPMPVEITPPAAAAATYEEEIRQAFGAGLGAIPRFDLILLGMGPDGHTASIFPGGPIVAVQDKLVADAPSPSTVQPQVPRLTFTFPLINAARRVLFLVTAKGKEQALRQALTDTPDPAVPASLARPQDGELVWMIDEAGR